MEENRLFHKMTEEEQQAMQMKIDLANALAKIKYLEEKINKPKKDPNEKEYILLFCNTSGYENQFDARIAIGRQDAYSTAVFILQNADSSEDYDIRKSTVIVEGVYPENRITLYDFMKHMENFIDDPSFDIDDYDIGDIESEKPSNSDYTVSSDDVSSDSNTGYSDSTKDFMFNTTTGEDI